MRWDFFVRHYTDDARQGRDPKYRATIDGSDGGRRAVPARRHARRLHRAQRDDLRLSAQLRTGTRSRISPAMRRGAPSTCARTSSASRTAAIAADRALLEPARPQPQPARLGRLAADREGDSAGGVHGSTICARRSSSRRSAALSVASAARSATARPAREPRRSQRLARRLATSAIGLRYTPLTTREPRARRHARAGARRRRAGTRIG